ncbi:MAG: thiolase family protein [Candidatus Micrarchaeota archaeon]|nr:thiolase family protein [Candidatus Micrarchaeota archaeon]MDE1834807.1 thiolase family protein [Candidatus Micrarchaeota archaeon]MDE1859450.1 thiolase family protein [Candidatus Micrarchaeota archaeon]
MAEVYIVDAARSPIGKFLGSLKDISAPMLGSEVIKGILNRTKIDARDINEAIVGNVISAGLGQNLAKQTVVYAGLPNEIAAYAVNMVCASSLKAVSLGAESISLGDADIVLAGGIESMSNAPFAIHGVRQFQKFGNVKLADFLEKLKQNGIEPAQFELVDEMLSEGLMDCYSNLHMGSLAEKLAGEYKITRREEDQFALESHKKAAKATDSGKFKQEIIPIKLQNGNVMSTDEGIRRDTSIEKLAALKPVFAENGTITAGNASQLSDGASFVLLMSDRAVRRYGLKPLAKIDSFASSGSAPDRYGMAPVPAVKEAISKAHLKIDDIDLIEINEAFCLQTLAVVKELGIDRSRLNVNGGATAIGHPLGATGACILSTLVYSLQDRGKETGLATLCHGGGGAAAMVVSRT